MHTIEIAKKHALKTISRVGLWLCMPIRWARKNREQLSESRRRLAERLRTPVQWLLGVAALSIIVVVLLWGPEQMLQWVGADKSPDYADLLDKYRRTLAQILAGAGGVLLVWFTWRRTRTTEQGHITDRYTKAIEQLGKTENDRPNIEVRLGAIYALERIAQDSPRDHWSIMEVLTAYIRRNAPWPVLADPGEQSDAGGGIPSPRTDIQAILTVLSRRRRGGDREKTGQYLDLSGTDLRGANLRNIHLGGGSLDGANLERASLQGAHLEDASMVSAWFKGAGLGGAHLERAFGLSTNFLGANLAEAHLEGAQLMSASFRRARLARAHLEGADLVAADLREATLRGTDLRGADLYDAQLRSANVISARFISCRRLTTEQVLSAVGWRSAILDPAFRREVEAAEEELNLQSRSGEGSDPRRE